MWARCRGLTLGVSVMLVACSNTERTQSASPSPTPEDAAQVATVDASITIDAPAAPATPPAKVLQVVVRGRTACARRSDGKVRCWGRPWTGTHGPIAAVPVELDVPRAADIDLAADGTVYVITTEGAVLTGTFGVTATFVASPLDGAADVIDVTVSERRPFVITRTGKLFELASNRFKQVPGMLDVIALAAQDDAKAALLREGQVSRRFSREALVRGIADATVLVGARCAKRRDGAIACWDDDGRLRPWTGAANIIDRVYGRGFSCDLTSSGVACRGTNAAGQLGAGSGPDSKTPNSVTLPATPVSLSAGDRSTCAVLDTGEVACWGANNAGQIGDGTLIDREVPVVVPGLTTARPMPPSKAPLAAQQSATAMDWAGLPSGCTRPSAIALDAAAPFVTPVSAYAYSRSDKLEVMLADFQLEPTVARQADPPTRGDQRVLSIELHRGSSRTTAAIDRGVYAGGSDVRRSSRSADLTSYDGDAMSSPRPRRLAVEVTHVDKAWICGRLGIAGATIKLQPFAARIATPR
ncbi:MAG: RCC1 domain-containing protein [Kofleriaceae bacterium]